MATRSASYRAEHPANINILFIKSRRALLGMTQDDLANMLGINAKTLSRYLHNGDLPISALFDIADILGCQAEDLVIR